jgi:hypothetical protein
MAQDMRPSRVSAELRRIAAGIDSCSTRVRRDLVSRDVRRVLTAMQTGDGHEIDGVTVEATVTGTFDGQPFEAKLYWEPTTGDPADFEPVSGPDGINPTDLLELIQSGTIS